MDFVGVEFQTLDTTGSVWPERQRLLKEVGSEDSTIADDSRARFGMNWKMTAKTILVQLHHKVQTFENMNKHLMLAIQDVFLDYVRREFDFSHVQQANGRDSLQIHAYRLDHSMDSGAYRLQLDTRHSTNAAGVAIALGLQASQNVEVEQMSRMLEMKISDSTRFDPMT